MKSRILLVFLAVALAVSMVLFSACPAPPEEEAPPPPPEEEAPPPPPTLAPYKIGLNVDLTGGMSYLGTAKKRGAEWVAAKINAAGGVNGRQLELVVYDSASDPPTAVQNTIRMIDVDKVVISGGYSSTETSYACMDKCREAHTVLFASNPCIITGRPVDPWLFAQIVDQQTGLLPPVIDNLVDRGCSKIAFIYLNIEYGATGVDAFEALMAERGLTPVIMESYEWGTIDYTPQIMSIKASEADGLLITGLIEDTVSVLKTARDLGIDYPIVSDAAVCDPAFIELGGIYVEGIPAVAPGTLYPFDLPDTYPTKQKAIELYNWYTTEYGFMSVFSSHMADQLEMIAEALGKLDPNLDPSKDEDLVEIRAQLRDNIEGIKNHVGYEAVYNYSPTNHMGLEEGCYPLFVVKDGVWRILETVEAEYGPIDTWASK